MSPQDFSAFAVSLKLGLWVTALLLIAVLPLAWILTRARGRGRGAFRGLWVVFAESLITLPMVLPPTVLGFFLLLALSPRGGLGGAGAWMDAHLGLRWVFSFPGLVLASCLSGLPFMYTALRNGIQAIPPNLFEASYLLGRGPWKTLLTVALPNMKAAVATALVLTFAHALGEFGVVLMVGGSIPGVTKTLSIAIYEKVEMMDDRGARLLSVVLLGFSYAGMVAIHLMAHLAKRRAP